VGRTFAGLTPQQRPDQVIGPRDWTEALDRSRGEGRILRVDPKRRPARASRGPRPPGLRERRRNSKHAVIRTKARGRRKIWAARANYSKCCESSSRRRRTRRSERARRCPFTSRAVRARENARSFATGTKPLPKPFTLNTYRVFSVGRARIILLEGANHTFGGRATRPARIKYNPAERLSVLRDPAARRE
jgi:hypothetical protein